MTVDEMTAGSNTVESCHWQWRKAILRWPRSGVDSDSFLALNVEWHAPVEDVNIDILFLILSFASFCDRLILNW